MTANIGRKRRCSGTAAFGFGSQIHRGAASRPSIRSLYYSLSVAPGFSGPKPEVCVWDARGPADFLGGRLPHGKRLTIPVALSPQILPSPRACLQRHTHACHWFSECAPSLPRPTPRAQAMQARLLGAELRLAGPLAAAAPRPPCAPLPPLLARAPRLPACIPQPAAAFNSDI